jgi:hypothetical protein
MFQKGETWLSLIARTEFFQDRGNEEITAQLIRIRKLVTTKIVPSDSQKQIFLEAFDEAWAHVGPDGKLPAMVVIQLVNFINSSEPDSST